MRTLIVLCAGDKKLGKLPIGLNRHPDGKLLAEKAVEGIYPQNYNRIIFTVSRNSDRLYDSRNILLKELKDRYCAEVIVLPKETHSPAESVYEALKQISTEGDFAVRDVTNAICIDHDLTGNFTAGLNLARYEDDIRNIRKKSFIVENEQHQVLDIIEKKIRSDVISAGLYGFHSCKDFQMAYEHLSGADYPIHKLYVSHIISYLIGYKKRVFHCAAVNNIEDWSDEEAWNLVLRRHAVCFVNLELLFLRLSRRGTSDLEGFSGMNKSGMQMDVSTIELLRQASRKGMKFAGYLKAGSPYADNAVNPGIFTDMGINMITIIQGLSLSRYIGVYDDIRSLENFITGCL